MSISGRAIRDEFVAVAGEDSLQALILALSLATDRIPNIAQRVGGHIHWLGQEERVILGRHVLSAAAENALLAMNAKFVQAAEVLDSGTPTSKRYRDRAVAAMRAIVRGAEKSQPSQPRRRKKPT